MLVAEALNNGQPLSPEASNILNFLKNEAGKVPQSDL